MWRLSIKVLEKISQDIRIRAQAWGKQALKVTWDFTGAQGQGPKGEAQMGPREGSVLVLPFSSSSLLKMITEVGLGGSVG